MLRIPTPAIPLALLLAFFSLLAAAPSSAQPFFLVYASQPAASPACNLGIDPASLQGGNPSVAPVLPPIDVPVGQTRTAELCFLVWPVASSGTGQAVCSTGSGTESCAEQLIFTTNAGIEIAGFTPVPPQDSSGFPKYDARFTPHSLRLMGGHPLAGRQGSGFVGVSLGTISLFGVLPAGTFSLSDGSWVAANMQSRAEPDTAIATTLNQCGNGVLDPGEACEDGNAAFGDGCAPTCRLESDFTLEGAMGPLGSTGSLALQIDGVDVVLDLASLPNAPAEEVMLALVTRVEDEPAIGATAVQGDDPSQPGADDGRRFVTDGEITGGPALVVSNGSIAVPEPGLLAGLAAGIGLLAALRKHRDSRVRA